MAELADFTDGADLVDSPSAGISSKEVNLALPVDAGTEGAVTSALSIDANLFVDGRVS